MAGFGERVAVLRREEGTDVLGDPVGGWAVEYVDGVLVMPVREGDPSDPDRVNGSKSRYSLAFPKSYEGDVAGCKVALVDRGMDAEDAKRAFDVEGEPGRTVPCPTRWNMLAYVGREDG